MGITSLDIINDLSTRLAKIINILDFDSKKLSIIKTKKKTKYEIKIYLDECLYVHDNYFEKCMREETS